jgi:integrase
LANTKVLTPADTINPLWTVMQATPIIEVSARLGHADITTMLRVYTHFIPKMSTETETFFGGQWTLYGHFG